MKKVVKKILLKLYSFLIWSKIVKPEIIVMMDGGICSQMHQYLLGCIYREKGYLVTYDLAFYRNWAKDENGVFDRNFDLLKAFPLLCFQKANQWEAFIYSKVYATNNNYFDQSDEDIFLFDIKPPKYLGGYFHSPKRVFTDLLPKYFQVSPDVLDDDNKLLYREIESVKHSVALHIRRGDLKATHIAYGEPASIEYFRKAVSYMNRTLGEPYFYIFSDELTWVKNELIKELSIHSGQYNVVAINGVDKGYMDLFLMARCAHQITSKGSLGKFAALLSNSSEKIVVLCDDPSIEYVWKERLLNTVFL